MGNSEKHIPFIFIFLVLLEWITDPKPFNVKCAGLAGNIVFIIFLFLYLEKPYRDGSGIFRTIPAKNFFTPWNSVYCTTCRYRCFLTMLLSKKADVLYLLLFIVPPIPYTLSASADMVISSVSHSYKKRRTIPCYRSRKKKTSPQSALIATKSWKACGPVYSRVFSENGTSIFVPNAKKCSASLTARDSGWDRQRKVLKESAVR